MNEEKMPPPPGAGRDDGDRRAPHQESRAVGLAHIALGVSILVGAGAMGYFWLQGDLITAIGAGILFVGGGVWEYRRRQQDAAIVQQFSEKIRER